MPSMQWVLRIWELWLCACYLRKSGTRTSPIRTRLLSSLLPRPGSAVLRQHRALLQPVGFPPAALSEIAAALFHLAHSHLSLKTIWAPFPEPFPKGSPPSV